MMSTNSDGIEVIEAPLLKMDIDGRSSIIELTAQVNGICEQVEEESHAVMVLHFTKSSLREWPGPTSIQDVSRWERAVRRLERLAAAIIAMASGTIRGPILDLLLVCDYRIAATDLRLHMSVNDGHVWPGLAIHRLVNQVGVAWSRKLVMWAHEITAQRAFDMGLVDEISNITLDTMRAAVSRFNPMSGAEIAIRRQLLLEAPTTTFEEALGTHLAACDRELRRLGGTEEG